MGTFDEKTKTWVGDVEPDKPQVWDGSVWRAVDATPPEKVTKKVAKKKAKKK